MASTSFYFATETLVENRDVAGDDNHGMIERGFMVYDALVAWLRRAAEERHNWPAKAA